MDLLRRRLLQSSSSAGDIVRTRVRVGEAANRRVEAEDGLRQSLPQIAGGEGLKDID